MHRGFVAAAVVMMALPLGAADRPAGRMFATRSIVYARHGMVAAAHPLAVQIAVDVLKRGGTAVDAAIAAERGARPDGAHRQRHRRRPVRHRLGREDPEALRPERQRPLAALAHAGGFSSRGLDHIPPYGPLPVTVPGCVDGWFELHAQFGRLPMPRSWRRPRARPRGVPGQRADRLLWGTERAVARAVPALPETFTHDGRAPAKGEIWRNPALADTRAHRREGRDVFYKGDIARTIARTVKEAGGFLSYEDLAAHHSEWVEPVSTNYRGVRRLGAAAQRPGDRRAADPEHPRGLRPAVDGLRQRRPRRTPSSRPRSWPSRTGRASTPTRTSPRCPWSG